MPSLRDRKSRTKRNSEQEKSKPISNYEFPNEQERLLPYAPGRSQVAAGTSEEIMAWLRGVPGNTRVILISFQNEASYKIYGPILWYVAQRLPEIVMDIQRSRFEHLVDALTEELLARQ